MRGYEHHNISTKSAKGYSRLFSVPAKGLNWILNLPPKQSARNFRNSGPFRSIPRSIPVPYPNHTMSDPSAITTIYWYSSVFNISDISHILSMLHLCLWWRQCFATFLPFRASASSFFWPFLFSDLLSSTLLFFLTLPISAFHLSILSEVWLLNFLRLLCYIWFDTPYLWLPLGAFANFKGKISKGNFVAASPCRDFTSAANSSAPQKPELDHWEVWHINLKPLKKCFLCICKIYNKYM